MYSEFGENPEFRCMNICCECITISLCFCTSSVPNVVRPKAQLNTHTIDKAFDLNQRQ